MLYPLICIRSTKKVDVSVPRIYPSGMLTPEQSRAARGWLDWSQEDLAKRANVSLSTVRDFEKGRRNPIANNLEAMERAFEVVGVVLQFDGNKPAGITVSTTG